MLKQKKQLFHYISENIIYHINNDKYFYNNLLKRICIGDYYDRIAFQNNYGNLMK